jgi:hypothetical protein
MLIMSNVGTMSAISPPFTILGIAAVRGKHGGLTLHLYGLPLPSLTR